MQIPLAKPYITEREEAAVIKALRSGWLTHGPINEQLETAFAEYIGAKYAITLNSCASALHLALVAYGIKDEVLIPSFTWSATANAVLTAGAKPVWVDIEPDSYGMDPRDLERKITPRSAAIIVVHYAGQMCSIDEISQIAQKYQLLLIEDSAETIGGTYQGRQAGSYGVGCFSFFPTKNMTTGEGGMITTNDAKIATTMKTIARHGMQAADPTLDPWYKEAVVPGYNFRLSGALAALGLVQLERLDEMNALRRKAAAALTSALVPFNSLLRPPIEKPGYHHVYQMYVVEVLEPKYRDPLVRELRSQGVEAAVHFCPPVHLHSFYNQQRYPGHDTLSVTEEKSRTVMTLPLYPQMTEDDITFIAEAIERALNRVSATVSTSG